MNIHRVVAAGACLGMLVAVVAAQGGGQQGQPPAQPQGQQKPQGQAPPQQPTFRTGVNFVRVDVIASDKDGKPVTDLKQGDFEVLEDGKPQAIETFRFVNVTGNPAPDEPAPKAIRSDYDEESEAARDDVRLFAIFLDDYHVRRGADLQVRKVLTDFLQKDVGASDMVGLMYPLQPVSSIRMSRDHETLANAINKFEGRKYDYRPRNDIEEQYAMYPASVVERIRNQVSMSALEALAMHLGSLREGRKAIILVSEGYTNLLPPQLQDPISSMPGIGNPNRGNSNAGIDDRTAFFASVDLQNDLKEVYNQANKNNTTIYTLDPRGLTPFEFDINQGVNMQTDRNMLESTLDTLRVLADQTDGRAIVNRNDLEAGLKQVVRDSSAYYLVGYSSAKAPADGRFHEIKVRIRRPGVQVRARKGYWALTADEMKASLEPPKPSAPPAVTKALGAIEQTHRARFIRTWVGTSRGENGKTRVTFVWEPLPTVPGQDRNQATGVSIVASGSGDQPYFRGRVGETPAAAAPAAAVPAGAASAAGGAQAAAAGRVTFDAPPGNLQLRISVQGGSGGTDTLDTDVREIKVPDLTAPQAAVSTPMLYRTANAREFREVSASADPMPTTAREFRRTERLLIRFDAYGPGNAVPDVTARVLNRAGTPMADLTVQAPQGNAKYYQLDVPLAGFASGEYLLEIKAKAPDGEAQELVPIRVTS
jgi:VWFA-related protein